MGLTEVGTSFMEQVIFIFPSLSCLCSYPPLRNYQVIPGQEPIVVLSLWSLLAALFGLGLAIGVVIAVRICCKCCKYFENFLIAGWPSLLLSIPIHSSEPDRFDTRYVFSQLFKCSGIEDWIREKADYRLAASGTRFVWPYDVGRWNNLKQVIKR